MQSRLLKIAALAGVALLPLTSHAATAVPAPGVLELVGLGAVVGIAIAAAKRRNRK